MFLKYYNFIIIIIFSYFYYIKTLLIITKNFKTQLYYLFKKIKDDNYFKL